LRDLRESEDIFFFLTFCKNYKEKLRQRYGAAGEREGGRR
jgi:hypothetical protein